MEACREIIRNLLKKNLLMYRLLVYCTLVAIERDLMPEHLIFFGQDPKYDIHTYIPYITQ